MTRYVVTSEMVMRPSYARAIPRPWRHTARLFVALGDEHRQRILLMFEPGERLNVAQIAGASTLSRSAVTHHLRVLRDAGVLKREKIGKEAWFWPDLDAIRGGLASVLDFLGERG